MATFYSGYSNTYRLILTVSESSYSIADNTSKVSWKLQVSCGASYAQWNPGPGDFYVTINGKNVLSSNNPSFWFSGMNTTITIGSGTTTVDHNSDGSKSISCSAKYTAESTASYLPSSMSASGTLSLTTIPRASTISSLTASVSVNGKNSVILKLDRKSSSFTSTVVFKASDTYKVTFEGVETDKEYIIPVTWMNAIGTSSSLTCSCTVTTYNASGTQIGDVQSKNFTITKASASTFTSTSATECNGTNALSVTITPQNSVFTHTVKFAFGSNSKSNTSVGTSTSYVPPMSWLNSIPNATSGTGTITVTTYYGEMNLGSTSKNFTLTVPSSVIPSISSVTLSPVNSGNLKDWGICVQNLSKLSVAVSASGSYSSTISKYYINGIETTSNPYTIKSLSSVGTYSIIIKVVDSRGRESDEIKKTITLYEYSAPTLNVDDKKVFRCDANGTEKNDGTYVSVLANFSYSPCNNKNSITTTVKVRDVDTTTYTDKGTLKSGTASILSGFDGVKAYDIWIVATDGVGNTASHHVLITARKCYWSMLPNFKGYAVGVITTREDTFEVGYKVTRLSDSILRQVATYEGSTVTTDIGSTNQYYCHYMTDAPNGHYFNKKLTVDGEFVATGHSALASVETSGALKVGGALTANSGATVNGTLTTSVLDANKGWVGATYANSGKEMIQFYNLDRSTQYAYMGRNGSSNKEFVFIGQDNIESFYFNKPVSGKTRVFSNDEVWDGEYDGNWNKVYRRTWNFKTSASDVTSWKSCGLFTASGAGINRIVRIEGYSGAGSAMRNTYPRYESGSYYLLFAISNDNFCYKAVGYRSEPVVVTIWYTKTTE